MDKEKYCRCFEKMNEFLGEGSPIGIHFNFSSLDGCGGVITDKMLKAQNPNHYKLEVNNREELCDNRKDVQ